MADTAGDSLSPLTRSLLRLIPVVTTFTITMCHFDQQLIFSSLLSTRAPPQNSPRVLSHIMRNYVRGALPWIIVLEFSSYACFAANVYYRVPLWKWYGFGLACFLTHLVNAPYSWKLLTAIQREDDVAGKEGQRDKRVALEEFVWMNKLRLVLTEMPLMAIVIAGAL